MKGVNTARPMIMHIDLNSCFATIEQQSRPMLRGRPVVVVNRLVKNATIITASYEAKGRGVKTGMRLTTALLLCPTLATVESDPPKYRFVYRQLMRILADYSPKIQMKSIDEGLIDFNDSPPDIKNRELRDIGREIKGRLKGEVGEWMRCNVGIGTNRFLAKTAAGLHKPDGLDEITHDNLKLIYRGMKLEDLNGIATGYARRLRRFGINSPIDFLNTGEEVLTKQVFESKCGNDWYRRLRGWEVDEFQHDIKSIGRQFVMDNRQANYEETKRRFYRLAEDIVMKLRLQGLIARGVKVYLKNYETGRFQNIYRQDRGFDDEATLFRIITDFIQNAPLPAYEIGITCYGLSTKSSKASDLFGEVERTNSLTRATDNINLRWGLGTIHRASTLKLEETMASKIAFNGTRFSL